MAVEVWWWCFNWSSWYVSEVDLVITVLGLSAVFGSIIKQIQTIQRLPKL